MLLFCFYILFSDRRAGSSMSGYQKDDYNWRYDKDELPEDIIRASTALENLQLDRKARNLTTSWRSVPSLPTYCLLLILLTMESWDAP